jgi:hypothetical protein
MRRIRDLAMIGDMGAFLGAIIKIILVYCLGGRGVLLSSLALPRWGC